MCNSLVFVLLVALPAVFAALPNGWQACSRSAADYDSCLKKEASNAITTLLNGDKGLGVLPLDPLRIDSLKIPRGNGPVSFDLTVSNVDISGIKDLTIHSINNDWKRLEGTAHIPDLYVLGSYNIDGQVLVLPIKGDGKLNITVDDLDMDFDIDWKKSQINGKEVFQMEKFHLNLKPKRVFIQLDNLFNGDKALGDQTNKFLNENWQAILDEFRPALTEGLSQAFTQIANTIMSKIPAEEVDIE